MGIYGVMGAALSGLRVTQASIELVGRNVANADTPGYTRKTREPSQLVSGDMVTGLRLGDVQRQLNTLVQRQYRIEASGAGYVNTLSRYYEHIDTLFGEPGSPIGLDTLYNDFQKSLEELTVSPESFTARDQFLRDTQALTQNINQMSEDMQGMRREAERGLGDGVQRVNELLQQLETINQQISSSKQIDTPPADLMDKRDAYINELSRYMDIKVMERERGMVSVFTQSGALLLDLEASELTFDERGTIKPQSQYSSNDGERGVGTIRLKTPEGLEVDMIKDNAIRSGELAALVELRDTLLPQAQAQLDALADSLARSLSAQEAAVSGAVDGSREGFDIDLEGMQAGDRFELTFTVDGETQTVTVIGVDDPDTLPLDDTATPRTDDRVIGVDLSGGMAGVAAQLAAEFGPAVDVQAPGGDTLRFLDDGDGQAVSNTGGSYGVDGTGYDLSALAGETVTVSIGGVDHDYTFAAGDTGADLQAFLDGIGGLSASFDGGELEIEGDTPATGFTIAVSDPSVSTATGLDARPYNTASVGALSGSVTATGFSGEGLGIPLFIDGDKGGVPYTDSFDGTRQQIGFAGRIRVNPEVLADNSKLVIHDDGIASGDPARPVEMLRRLTEETTTYSGALGMGTATPYEGTVSGFTQRIIAHQGAMTADIERGREAQQMVVSQLEERFTAESGVNVDQEMARLIELQTAYTANTRVVSAAREMMDLILQM